MRIFNKKTVEEVLDTEVYIISEYGTKIVLEIVKVTRTNFFELYDKDLKEEVFESSDEETIKKQVNSYVNKFIDLNNVF